MTTLEKLEASLNEMYEFSNKMYAVLDKSGKDRHLAGLLTEASDRNEIFLAEQLEKARESMDQTYALIEYLHRPVLYDGRLKKTRDGRYSLCGNLINHRIGIEYVKDDKWHIGLIQIGNNEYEIVDENLKKISVTLENLRVRCREKLD